MNIQKETLKDKDTLIIRGQEEVKNDNRLLIYRGLIYMPRKLRNNALQEYYNDLIAGYFGIEKIIARLTETYYWPRI